MGITMPRITVYYFESYDIIKDEIIRSKRMATLETIKRFNCTPLMDTAKDVDVAEVDGNGRYSEIESDRGKT